MAWAAVVGEVWMDWSMVVVRADLGPGGVSGGCGRDTEC